MAKQILGVTVELERTLEKIDGIEISASAQHTRAKRKQVIGEIQEMLSAADALSDRIAASGQN